MSVNVTLILADWFADATYGVAALLPSVPIESGFTVGTIAGIYDEARDSEVTRAQVPDADLLPALMVQTDGANVGPLALQPFPNDHECEVIISYVLKDSNTADAWIACDTVERALKASVQHLFRTSAGDTARNRNSVQLLSQRSWQVRTMRSNDDVYVSLIILASFATRDVWAGT